METGMHTTTLTGADGSPHRYKIPELPAGEGLEILLQLMGLLSPAVLDLVGAAIGAQRFATMAAQALASSGSASETVAQEDWIDLLRALSEVDLSRAGADLGRALLTKGTPELLKRMTRGVIRDDRPLDAPGAFDLAFRANYFELAKLLGEVVRVNRFFPQLDISAISKARPQPQEGAGETAPSIGTSSEPPPATA